MHFVTGIPNQPLLQIPLILTLLLPLLLLPPNPLHLLTNLPALQSNSVSRPKNPAYNHISPTPNLHLHHQITLHHPHLHPLLPHHPLQTNHPAKPSNSDSQQPRSLQVFLTQHHNPHAKCHHRRRRRNRYYWWAWEVMRVERVERGERMNSNYFFHSHLHNL
jgi:hypothetical protein